MSSHSSVLGSGGALEIGEAGLAGAATGVRPPSPPRDRMQAQRFQDALFHQVTRFFAFSVLAILVAILGALLYGAWPALKEFGAGFPFSADWNPVTDKFGGLISVYGTLSTSFIALFVAIPVSFGIALFLTELCPPSLRGPLGIAVELLAAVPSIIYGMWGLFVFAPLFADYVQPLLSATLGNIPFIGGLFQGPKNGIGILSAGLILSVMVIPFIASVMRDVFEVVPGILKESAYGLGATTWEVVWNVVLPYTRVGVIGGVMLGLGRALGETMAVTFVIGNAHRISPSLYEAGNSIASTLANEFAEASSDLHVSSLIALGLILFFVTFVVLALSKILLMRLGRLEGEKT
ncbi:MAG: phosphate ABC transporter permease subunit PstC [Azonexus sp.]|uniref:Phosphate transport system permease protein n=1 Tax=Zoogloea oleivorans TaxID=1552750 RepID=A0A6C2D257_9RHOO|nr:phosphate ABC transporter permease subunit PstC [Zoogloea oleivorans]MDX9943219.1 phosphate ABC transporter permease subunit PstC [Azonexus sp.]TYC59863.1 phosphate ABC transporter permease subunit PstC [Zoogloea oleivorans]